MAQTIKIKRSGTTGNKLTGSNSIAGEVGMNTADKSLYIQTGSTDSSVVTVYDDSILHLDDTNNRVGIGTTSPQSALEIRKADPTIRLHDTDTGARAVISAASGVGGFVLNADAGNSVANSYMQFKVDNTSRMYINSAGNIGIGTDSPSAPLSLLDASLTTQGTGEGGLRVHRPNAASQYGYFDYGYNEGGVNIGSLYTGGSASAFGTFTFRQHSNGSSQVPMFISSAGNVGIGTTSPAAQLHIGPNTLLASYTTNRTTLAVSDITNGAELILRGQSPRLWFDSTSGGNGQIYMDSVELQIYSGNPTSAGTQRLNINSSGAISFNEAFTFPTSDGSTNQVLKTDGSGNVTWATEAAVSAGTSMSDADGDTKIQVEESADEDTIRFDTAGSQRMVIASSGNVGINSASPAKTLTVGGSFQATGEAFFSHFDNITSSSRMRDDLRLNFGTARTFAITGNSTNMHIKNSTTDVMTFDTSNRIGIGTTSPGNKLQVNVAADDRIVLNQTAGQNFGLQFQYSGTRTWDIYNNGVAASKLFFYNEVLGASAMTIDTSGRVGIGTTSPSSLLHLKDTGDAVLIVEADSDNSTETDNARIELRQDGNNVAGYLYTEGNAGQTATGTLANTTVLESKGGGTDVGIHFATGGKAPAQSGGPTNGTVRMTILGSSGNVGIGTTAPETKLDVIVDSNSAYTSTMSGVPAYTPGASDIIQVKNVESGVDDIYAGIWFETGNPATNTTGTDRPGRIALVVDNNNAYSSNFVFQTRGGSGLTEKLRIQGDGNVGIGTSSPSYPLHVVGTGTAHQIRVERTGTGNANLGVDTTGAFIEAQSSIPLSFYQQASERIRITGGKVLINATSSTPADQLYVNGDAYITGGWRTGTSATFIGEMTNISGKLSIQAAANRDIQLGDTATPDIVYIDTSAQRVGIGDSTPSQKLDVRGATLISVGDAGSGHNTEFNWVKSNTGSGGANTWFKVADITISASAYSAMSFEAYYETGQNNFGQHEYLDVREVFCTITRNSTSTLNNSPDNAVLRGRTDDLRLYKTAVGTYELQARHGSANSKYAVRVRVFQTNGGTITPKMDGTTAGTTSGGTEYTVTTAEAGDAGIRHFVGQVDAQKIHFGNVDIYPSGDSNSLHISAPTSIIGPSTTTASNPSLGLSTYRWDGVFSSTGSFSGDVTVGGYIYALDSNSSTVPTIAFNGHTDTGISTYYSNSNDHLSIITDGAQRAYFNNAGITSTSNVYTSASGVFRNYAGTWGGTTGTANKGFYFLNTANSNTTKAMDLSHDGNVTFAGTITSGDNVSFGNSANISMDGSANGQVEIKGSGYQGAIALDGSNMSIYHNSSSRGLVLGTNETARMTISGTGVFDFHGRPLGDIGSAEITGPLVLQVSSSDTAHQRVDARDDATNFSRAHWYGVTDSGGTSNFRHAWYDGSTYINVTAASGTVTFGGAISSGNITTTGYLRGPSTFTIDPAAHGDNTGTVVIAGNLQVDGTTTTINSTTLTVDDKNITLASGSSNAAAANGAGITVDCGSGTDATLTYNGTSDQWELNKILKWDYALATTALNLNNNNIVGVNNIAFADPGANEGLQWSNVRIFESPNDLTNTSGNLQVTYGSTRRLTVDNTGIDVNGNITLSGNLGIDTTTTSTTATTQVAIDTMAAATFRSAKYTIQVTNTTDSTYHLTEILLIHDGTTPQITEYGTIFTGSAEATFDADISSGNVRLLATPATTDSMTFKVVRHCITV